MLQGFAKNIKNNALIFILLGIFLLLTGGLVWSLRVADVNYRFVPVLRNFLKLSAYALIIPLLILSILYPFLKRFPRGALSEKEPVSFMRRQLSFTQLTTGLLFLASFLVGLGIMSAVNSLLDSGSVQITKAKVIEKRIWHTRGGKEYILSVISWPHVNSSLTNIQLSLSEYQHLDVLPGDSVSIDIGKGALGIDWIASIEKDSKNSQQ